MMDLSSAMSLADPHLLADQIQYQVDSIAGRHVNLTSLQILADAIDGINIASILINIITIILIIILTGVTARLVDRILKNNLPRIVTRLESRMDGTLQLMIRRIAFATIYLIGLMLVILQVPHLYKIATAMLAGAGIIGLAIGYAARDSFSNFTSGIFIAVFQPFRVGDLVDFRKEYGQIEDLTLRHTVIRTVDNRRIIVPNSVMSKEPIINWTIREEEITWSVDFDLEKAADIDRARNIILDKARINPLVLKDRPMSVQLVSSRSAELILRLEVSVSGRKVAKVMSNEIREAVIKEFEAQGISSSSPPQSG